MQRAERTTYSQTCAEHRPTTERCRGAETQPQKNAGAQKNPPLCDLSRNDAVEEPRMNTNGHESVEICSWRATRTSHQTVKRKPAIRFIRATFSHWCLLVFIRGSTKWFRLRACLKARPVRAPGLHRCQSRPFSVGRVPSRGATLDFSNRLSAFSRGYFNSPAERTEQRAHLLVHLRRAGERVGNLVAQ